jgi:KDO2-lipid IV(A) lauroyltransferase
MALKTIKISHVFEALLAYSAYGFFALLPLDAASAVGGWLGRTIVSRMGVSRRAYRHLQLAMPHLTRAEQEVIVRQMWDNMGRNIAETPHAKELIRKGRLKAVGFEHAIEALKQGKGILVASGHFGNWEVGPIIFWDRKLPMTTVYRRPNNPLIDPLLGHTRRIVTPDLLPKGIVAAAGILKTLRQNGAVGLLVDQKMNTGGMMLKFFDQPAMTGLATAQLALKTGSPVIVATSVREGGAHFTFTLSEPLAIPANMSAHDAAIIMTQEINDRFEAHIRRYPGQWLWLHRRWGNRRKPWDIPVETR